MTASGIICPPATLSPECTSSSCRNGCALAVVDQLLGTPGAVSGEEADLLLDLRFHLRRREDAEAVIRLFCDLRRRLESRHYLAFYRLRRWIENHLNAAVRLCPAAEPKIVPLKLQFFCSEAIRRASLCSALGTGAPLLAPRVQFRFYSPVGELELV